LARTLAPGILSLARLSIALGISTERSAHPVLNFPRSAPVDSTRPSLEPHRSVISGC